MSAKRKEIDSPGTPSKRVCKVLTLVEKVQVIDAINSGLNNTKVASKFQCGWTQIANILLNKTAILEAYTNGTKYTTKYLQPRHCMYPEIDAKVWKFYCEVRSQNMPVNGGLLKAEALCMAKEKKSDGLHCFKLVVRLLLLKTSTLFFKI